MPTFTSEIPPTPATTPTLIPASQILPTPRERLVVGPPIAFIASDETELQYSTWLSQFLPHDGTDPFLAPSPNGRFLIFLGLDSSEQGCEPPPGAVDCSLSPSYFLADLANRSAAPLGLVAKSTVSWAPDGMRFVSSVLSRQDPDGSLGLSLVIQEAGSGHQTHLTDQPATDLYPSWSPDGNWIAFIRQPVGCTVSLAACNQSDLYTIRPDGTDLRLLREQVYFQAYTYVVPVWAPQDEWLAVIDASLELVLIQAATREQRVLPVGPVSTIQPTWSPDGRQLAFVSDRDGNREIYRVSREGTDLVNLTAHRAQDDHPLWSPSGHQIAFLSNRGPGSATRIFLMQADGSDAHPLAPFLSGGLAWLPD